MLRFKHGSAIEGLRAAELCCPGMPHSHRRWIPLNPRYLAGGILLDTLPRRSLNQNHRKSRRASSRQAPYGKIDLESALSSTSLIQVP
jgi:hypothetical protein